MTVTNSSQGNYRNFLPALRAAHDAIYLPEIQEMLCRLSAYNLGIFFPHMHDQETGEFEALPDDVMQVESGLEVSFQHMEEIENQENRFLRVGWCWRAGETKPVAACEMVREADEEDIEQYTQHKIPKKD